MLIQMYIEMLARVRKTIAEFCVFVNFHLYCTESDSPHDAYLKVGAYLSESGSRAGAHSRGLLRVFTVDV